MEGAQKTKKFINGVDSCVDDNIKGYLALHPNLRLLDGYRVILRHDIEKLKTPGRVCVLTGGGSGHEPAFAGYVGEGMACGTVQGAMFASPGPAAVLAAIRAVYSPHCGGVVMIFNNYTGDRLNFGLAMERAKAEGMKVGIILNADDSAVIGRDRTAGRRGLAGFVLLLKVVGAMAEAGKSFDEIMNDGQKVADGIATLGVGTSPCSVPGGGLLFHIEPDEMVIGLGLHGEAGIKTTKMMTAHDTVRTMLDIMSDPQNTFHIPLKTGDSVAILLNNLGSTSETEMNILVMETIEQLEQKGCKVERAYLNRYGTSQEMAGFSITVLKLDDILKDYLDAPTRAPAWMTPMLPSGMRDRSNPDLIRNPKAAAVTSYMENLSGAQLSNEHAEGLHKAIEAGCRALIGACDELNQLDSACGDGDCGTTLRNGAEALLNDIGSADAPKRPSTHPESLCLHVSQVLENAMGGCSGALYSLLFTSAAMKFRDSASLCSVKEALYGGITAIQTYGGAQPGDRTMLDPLHAAYTCLKNCQENRASKELLLRIAQAAEDACAATAGMEARAGRASYVGREHQTLPDAGARAVAVWLPAALQAFLPYL